MSSGICPRANEERIIKFTPNLLSLVRDFACNERSCGNHAHFSDYLNTHALLEYCSGRNITHLFCSVDEDENPVLVKGFITLRASSVLVGTESGGYVGVPSVEISELAVDKRYERQGIGSMLLKFAISFCEEVREYIGVRYLTVYADKMAVDFYKHVMEFDDVSGYEIPHDDWNSNCVPLIKQLRDIYSLEPCFYSEEDEDDEYV